LDLIVPALFLSAEWCHERTGLELARANLVGFPRAESLLPDLLVDEALGPADEANFLAHQVADRFVAHLAAASLIVCRLPLEPRFALPVVVGDFFGVVPVAVRVVAPVIKAPTGTVQLEVRVVVGVLLKGEGTVAALLRLVEREEDDMLVAADAVHGVAARDVVDGLTSQEVCRCV
jgi:hypothetical protein